MLIDAAPVSSPCYPYGWDDSTARPRSISDFPCRVSTPMCLWRNLLALHEEGIGVKHCALSNCHPIVDEGVDSDGGSCANYDVVGLEDSVFERVGLKQALRIERARVPDRDEGALDNPASVVEDPAADPN